MKKPLGPPELSALLRKVGAKRLVHSATLGLNDDYLHWDELRHRTPPHDVTPEEWWLALKLKRTASVQVVPLVDVKGRPFTYNLPGRVLSLLHEIDSGAHGRLLGESGIASPEARDRYVVSSLIEESITSSQLEGASTTRKVAAQMLRTGRVPRDRSERMILNNFGAMQHILATRDQPMTPNAVLALHRMLTEDALETADAAGRLQRPSEKRVCVYDNRDGTLLHEPPSAELLPDRLKSMCDFANGKTDQGEFIHPIIRAIVLHFWLAYDHPFEDGNGRTARALFYWAMLRHGYWLFEFVSISHLLRRAPARYARAFLYTETDDNDLTYFIIHQLDTVRKAIQALHAFLDRKADQLRAVEKLLGPGAPFNYRERALLSNALRHPGAHYTIKSHQRSHGVAYATARADLLHLAELGLVMQLKPGRELVFRVRDDIAARLEATRMER